MTTKQKCLLQVKKKDLTNIKYRSHEMWTKKEKFFKCYTKLWADTSHKEMNWQKTNNENQSITN
jgi:hypothetical protein